VFKSIYYFNFIIGETVAPKNDYLVYCQDLARQENAFYHEQHACSGLKFSEMLDLIFMRNKNCLGILQKTAGCIFVHTYPEFDPDYSHVGVYLKNKYALQCELFDVIAGVDVALSIAHHVLSQWLHKKEQQHGVVVWLDQPVTSVTQSDVCFNQCNQSVAAVCICVVEI
jgi:hypothetical protein